MEPLALLCNLYGDGPATLRRLQRAGCDSLPALLDLESRELAARTGWDSVEAERFLREAWVLAERLDQGLGGPAPPPSADHDGLPAPLPAAPRPEERPPRKPIDLRDEERRNVLGRWQELDRSDPPLPPADVIVPQPPPRRVGQPKHAGNSGHHPLEETFLPGLAPEHLAALRERGLGTLEAFAAVPTIGVARELGLGYTRVSRWQFLARKALAEGAEARPRPPPPNAAPRESPDPGRLDASGPFA